MANKRKKPRISSTLFFSHLYWLDGRPLLKTIEPYRRRLFETALDTVRPDGTPVFNFILVGRAKKNWKTTDLDLSALYSLIIRGGDCFILANDEGQAADDLDLAKKLVAANPDLRAELEVLQKEIRRQDGRGSLKILPAKDVIGSHGKTAGFLGYDEIHGYRNYDLFEALAPDPTRADALTWVTSYDTIYNAPGIPLYDFKQIAKAGADPRMLCSWYSGGWCTDSQFAELEPELRANPSIGAWPEGRGYLEQQKRRLPTHKYRRLHLNLPGAPTGAFFDQGKVMVAMVVGRTVLPYQEGRKYFAFVDMAGGSADDAVLAIGHDEDGRVALDIIVKQAGEPPYNPRQAVHKFVEVLRSYRLSRVMGDNFAGRTFAVDFESDGITYDVCSRPKTELYEQLEPALNAGEVELLDEPKLQEQLLTLVVRGTKIDHEPNGHDDWANAAAGCVWMIRSAARSAAEVKIVLPWAICKEGIIEPGDVYTLPTSDWLRSSHWGSIGENGPP
jgi:hypothetical protein